MVFVAKCLVAYCSHIQSLSLGCLAVYRSNRNMIQMLYDYDTRQNNLLHTPCVMSFGVDMKIKGKIWFGLNILLVNKIL